MILGKSNAVQSFFAAPGSTMMMMSPRMDVYLEKAKHHLGFVKSRVFRRVATIFLAFSFAVGFIIATVRLTNVGEVFPKVIGSFLPKIPTCNSQNRTSQHDAWVKAESKYTHLLDDKFT